MEKRRGHVRNASNWSTTSAVRKRTTTYNEKRDYHSVLQKFGEIDLNHQGGRICFIILLFSSWLPVWSHPFFGAFLFMVCFLW